MREASRSARLRRRLLLGILSPALIGSVGGFLATQAMELWKAKQAADISFLDAQRLKDDERIDEIRGKINDPNKEICDDIDKRIKIAQHGKESLRTDYGRVQIKPIIERINADKQICSILSQIDSMPNTTSGDVDNRIAKLQRSLESLSSDYGRNQLSPIFESLRGSRNAKRDAERLDEERRSNEAKVQLASTTAAIKAAQDAASASAARAAAARREATVFERGLNYRGLGRQRPH